MTDFTSITESLTTDPKYMLLMGILLGMAFMKYFYPHHHKRRISITQNIFSTRWIEPHGKVDIFLCKVLVYGIPFAYYLITAFFPLLLLLAISKQFGWWGIPIYGSLMLLICYLAQGITQPLFDDSKRVGKEIMMGRGDI